MYIHDPNINVERVNNITVHAIFALVITDGTALWPARVSFRFLSWHFGAKTVLDSNSSDSSGMYIHTQKRAKYLNSAHHTRQKQVRHG